MLDGSIYPGAREDRLLVTLPAPGPAIMPIAHERYAAGNLVGAAAGVPGQAQLWNPGAPTRRIVIDRATATIATTGLIYLVRTAAALTTLDRAWRSGRASGYPGIGQFRTAQAAFPAGPQLSVVRALADTPYHFDGLAISLGDEEGLTVVGGLNNVAITVTFWGREYPI